MNILFVDDQPSVLKGIESGVRFREIGVDDVFYASGVRQAREIISRETVDILLSDIEMPGESGLDLLKWVVENYPEMLCILLTSHADFSYAHESIRLGCFDYILQPAPYEQIEECLRRALQEIYERRKRSQIYHFGQMLKTNETELMNHAVSNLFSRVPEDKASSLELLNAMGYPISEATPAQLLILGAEGFRTLEKPAYSEKHIHKAISAAVKAAGVTYPVVAMSNVTHHKQFCVILFSVTGENVSITTEQVYAFYDKVSAIMPLEKIMCYVGSPVNIGQLRDEYRRIRKTMIEENIGNRPGLYLRSGGATASGFTVHLPECVDRWKALLAAGQKRMLENEIHEFIRNVEENGKTKHKDLCDLHQQLTHIFFSYLYDNNADMDPIFGPEYSYMDYMDSFSDANALRRAVRHMLGAVDQLQKKELPQSDVEKARSFIAHNISNPITVMDVADHVSLSAEYFTKLFKRETGQNIKEYIMQSKISAAKDLLEHSGMSVSMIALELGYSNFSHFTQVFKKYEDMTPSEYRAQKQGK